MRLSSLVLFAIVFI